MLSLPHLVCVTALLAIAPVTNAQDSVLSAPDGPILRLAPGESGTLRLRVQSATPVWTKMLASEAADDEYEFVWVGDAEGCADLEPQDFGRFVTFDPTVAGGDIDCVYAVHRAIDSINDLSMDLMPSNGSGFPISGSVALRFGVVPDLRFDVRQESVALLPDGRAQSVVSLVVWQSSDVALTGVTAGFCWIGNVPGFLMDGNFRGGCPGPAPGGGFCFDGGYGFALPTFAPHEATTCRVQLTSLEAYTTPLSYPIQLITWLMRDAATGGSVIASSGTLRFLAIDLDAIFRDRFE